MPLLFHLVLSLTLAAWVGRAAENPPAPAFPPYHRPVITWVPPYGLAKSRARLEEPGAAASLTHVALQFWTPTLEGTVSLVSKYDPLSDAKVTEWRDWAHARGLRVMLCVYNGAEKWDWGLAHAAFAEHREVFVQALLAELDRLGMDGIDLDLEGNGTFDADQADFIAFVARLSTEVHARGRQLFVDSFCYLWNAPNQRWWPELFPLVDGLSSMGYEETGATSPGWRGYGAQAAIAGENVAKLLIGLPTHLPAWQENTLLEHLGWFAKEKGPGVALWDAQFKAAPWRGRELWALLQQIRGE